MFSNITSFIFGSETEASGQSIPIARPLTPSSDDVREDEWVVVDRGSTARRPMSACSLGSSTGSLDHLDDSDLSDVDDMSIVDAEERSLVVYGPHLPPDDKRQLSKSGRRLAAPFGARPAVAKPIVTAESQASVQYNDVVQAQAVIKSIRRAQRVVSGKKSPSAKGNKRQNFVPCNRSAAPYRQHLALKSCGRNKQLKQC